MNSNLQPVWPSSDLQTTNGWRVINDGVMGGLSSGKFYLNDQGHGIFTGYVSLENNGGFTSARLDTGPISLTGKNKIGIRIRGDGKKYQLRIKPDKNQSHAFIQVFQTSLDWQDLEFDLSDFYPTFRGRRLNLPDFSAGTIEEITFLIANKMEEQFILEIASIQLIGKPN